MNNIISSVEEINLLYSELLNDINFDRIELEASKPNFFNILGAVHNELRHSNILSWLMTPAESHSLDEAFLKRFLREVAQDEKTGISQLEVEKLNYDEVEIRREWNNIDILIIFSNHVIVIENKIRAKEGGDQLTRYKRIAEEHFPEREKSFVFLTPDGYESDYETGVYASVSYRVILDSLERIMHIKSDELSVRMKILIGDYTDILRRHVMAEDETAEIAREIYKNHKKLFDFVYEYRPDEVESLKSVAEEFICGKGWVLGSKGKGVVRFTTQRLKDAIKPYESGGRWKNNEVVLFELNWTMDKTKIKFKLAISPGDNDELRSTLQELVESIPGVTKAKGKDWLTYFARSEPYNLEECSEEPEKFETSLNSILPHIKKAVEQVEKVFLDNLPRLQEVQP